MLLFSGYVVADAPRRNTTNPHSNVFHDMVLNACAACDVIDRNRNESRTLTKVSPNNLNSLIFSERAHVPDQIDKFLPWAVSSTDANAIDSSRTWFISFCGDNSYMSTFANPTLVPIPSKCFPNAYVHAGIERRIDVFDTRFVVSLLSASTHHKVVLCGYSLGGAVAVVQFMKILQSPSLNGKDVVLSGRCVVLEALMLIFSIYKDHHRILTVLNSLSRVYVWLLNYRIDLNFKHRMNLSARLKCVTFGSPLVGDLNFAADLRTLSREAVLRNPDTDELHVQPCINFIHEVVC